MKYIKRGLSYIGFGVVVVGIVILNVTKPPWQFLGLAIFAAGILYPAIEPLWELVIRRYKQPRLVSEMKRRQGKAIAPPEVTVVDETHTQREFSPFLSKVEKPPFRGTEELILFGEEFFEKLGEEWTETPQFELSFKSLGEEKPRWVDIESRALYRIQ